MAFEWTPDRIADLSDVCHKAHDVCRNGPAEFQKIATRISRISQKLELFFEAFSKSGLNRWEHAPELERRLRHTLDPLLSSRPAVKNPKSAPRAALDFAHLVVHRKEVRQIEAVLDFCEQEVDKMKADFIMSCALQLSQNAEIVDSDQHSLDDALLRTHFLEPTSKVPISRLTPSSISADVSSVQSVASSTAQATLARAMMLRSRPCEQDDLSLLGFNTRLWDEQSSMSLVNNVVSHTETTAPYPQDTHPANGLRELKGISSQAVASHLPFRTSNADQTNPSWTPGLPSLGQAGSSSLGNDIFGHLSSTSDSASVRVWALEHSQGSQPNSAPISSMAHFSPPVSRAGGAPSSGFSFSTNSREEGEIFDMDLSLAAESVLRFDLMPSSREGIDLKGSSKIYIKKDMRRASACSFAVDISEGSIVINSFLEVRSGHDSKVPLMSGALAPSSKEPTATLMTDDIHTSGHNIRLVRHCFEPRSRPIPHFLHPAVEGPDEEPKAPYTITFTQRQYVSIENGPRPRWSSSLKYIFTNLEDRKTMSQCIFGKTLLASAGANKIVIDGKEVAHMVCVSLWQDRSSQALSLTFTPILTSGPKTKPVDIELQVHGLWQPERQQRITNMIAIEVETMPELRVNDDHNSDLLVRTQTARSKSTFLSGTSTTAFHNKSKRPDKLKCAVEFSQPRDKIEVQACLTRHSVDEIRQ